MKTNDARDTLEFVSPKELVADFNVRDKFDETAMAALIASMMVVGMLHPIRVRRVKGRLVVIDGARRLMAASRLGWDKVCIIIDGNDLTDSDVVQRQLIANIQREDLSPFAEAKAIRDLLKATQWTVTEGAEKLGKSPSSITKSLSLLNLPEAILAKVDSGELPPSSAYELTRVKDPVKQSELAEQALNGKLTRDDVGRAVRATNKTTKPKHSTMSRASASLDADRSITVSGPNLDIDRFIGWLEELLAKARRERTRGVALATFIKVMRDQARTAK